MHPPFQDFAWRNKIQRANLDGSEPEDVLTSGVHGPYEIALDIEAGMMY